MPKTYHTAAKSTREMADERRKQLSTVGWLVIGAVIIVYILLTNSSSLRIGGIGILVLLFAIRLLPDWFDGYSHRKEKTIRRADRGADAEEQIRLSALQHQRPDPHDEWSFLSCANNRQTNREAGE